MIKKLIILRRRKFRKYHKTFCPICGDRFSKGMGSGRIYMLHQTIGCDAARRY